MSSEEHIPWTLHHASLTVDDAKNLHNSLNLQQAVLWKRIHGRESLKVKREALTRSKTKETEKRYRVECHRIVVSGDGHCASLSCKIHLHVQILTKVD